MGSKTLDTQPFSMGPGGDGAHLDEVMQMVSLS